ncbi:MAG: hypothetical protein KAW87_02335 [Candidatus Cloacimonetes bacterium]|nr:hypothetical protein [Candidatus Cloacimonadota bacterium]
MGDFLDEELIQKIPAIDFIVDCFETELEGYHRNNILQKKIIHINFKKLLIIEIIFFLVMNEDNQVIIDSLTIYKR